MEPTTRTEPEPCPDCGEGTVVPTSAVGNPMAVQYVCSAGCGWNA